MASPEDSQEIMAWITNLEAVEPSSQSTTPSGTPSQRSSAQGRNSASPMSSVGTIPRAQGRIPTGATTISGSRSSPASSWTTGRSRIQDDDQDESVGYDDDGLADDEFGEIIPAGDDNLQTRKRPIEAPEPGLDQENKVPRLTRGQSAPNTGMTASAFREPLPEIRHTSQRVIEPRMGRFIVSQSQPNPRPAPIAEPAQSIPGPVEVFAHQQPSVSAVTIWRSTLASASAISEFPEAEVIVHNHRCINLPISCELSSYSVLLSPCVANTPYIADLLRIHGIQQFINDPVVWTASRYASTKRMIILESQRVEATTAFTDEVKSYDFKKRDSDEHEFIPVFDWRILERLKREEYLKGRESRVAAQKDERFAVVNKRRLVFGPIWKPYWRGLV